MAVECCSTPADRRALPAHFAQAFDTIAAMSEAEHYNYELPSHLIAQEPLAKRSDARLLVVRRSDGAITHRHVRDLADLLRPHDLMVVNDTRVVPARLIGRRMQTGGRWQGLFVRIDASGAWQLLAHTRGRLALGEQVMLVDRAGVDRVVLNLVSRAPGGTWLAVPESNESVGSLLLAVGRVPLPGYIRGGREHAGDSERYQTVFARTNGAAAAPTAGLHFTEELLAELAARQIAHASVTLHVGLDTFRPITADKLADHPMHSEWCECLPETVEAVRATQRRGGRIIAIGTTAVRTLETASQSGVIGEWSGPTDLFIKPGFAFRTVDCLLTNFHMPRTTLMVLVSAFASRSLVARAYNEAIREAYRFLSYGDAMLIE